MSIWELVASEQQQPTRRIRDEIRDGLAVVAASAVASVLLAFAVLVLMKLAG